MKFDDAMYEALLERQLAEERAITESDSQLGRMLDTLSSDLAQLGARMERQLRPEVDAVPAYEDVVLSRLVDELQATVEGDRQLLQRRDEVLLGELEEKVKTLRLLSARLDKQRGTERSAEKLGAEQGGELVASGRWSRASPSPGHVSVATQPPAWSGNEELFQFLEGSALPVALSLAATLLVTWLSQQFLRVARVWRRTQWYKAERVRKVQLRRLQQVQETFGRFLDRLARGEVTKARGDWSKLTTSVSRWASEPTWEEVARTEAAAFWERWGPEAFQLEAALPRVREATRAAGPKQQAQWVVERWWSSAQAVVKDAVEGALAAWAQDGDLLLPAGQRPEATATQEGLQAKGSGLVIRIFGRWPQPAEWVNIANLPLAGDWREKALRLLLPAEKDVKDLPVLGPLCETLLTAVVSNQVGRALSTNAWGGLTTDLWRLGGSHRPFQIGYEVVEVAAQAPEEMCAIARSLPRGGTPGRVVRVPAGIESELGRMER